MAILFCKSDKEAIEFLNPWKSMYAAHHALGKVLNQLSGDCEDRSSKERDLFRPMEGWGWIPVGDLDIKNGDVEHKIWWIWR